MAPSEYQKKRSFAKTPEPKAGRKHAARKDPLHFVVQKHDASHLHYDFRLELDGVLKSWAVPKGPSLNPKDKRLAMETEDHPYSYKDFEGTIPEGQYGAGDVIVWDEGAYAASGTADPEESRKKLKQGYRKGELSFVLAGEKLRGEYTLVKMKGGGGTKDNAWLLLKSKDEYASTEDATRDLASVKTGGTLPRDAKSAPRKKAAARERAARRGTSRMPHGIKPMLATLVEEPFDRAGWIFETKWDGYRAIAEVERGRVTLYSRNGIDFTQKYAPVTEALEGLGHDAVLDGEIIAVPAGVPDFHALQEYERRGAPLQYALFDLLYLDGEDLRRRPLTERKELLRQLIPDDARLLFSEHVERRGKDFFMLMRSKGLEGMLAKDGASVYHEGKRTESWQKVKSVNEQEAVIIGFSAPRGGRKHLGALVLGAYEDGTLRYIGHSGGGFTSRELEEMHARLAKIARKTPTVKENVPANAPITWVSPRYVCEIRFTEWTPEGYMRHPVYIGMRPDRDPKQVVRESAARVRAPAGKAARESEPELTHEDKVFWPEEGYTKGDLIEYYRAMAPTMLPYLAGRPENLNRHPNGYRGKSFYQKDMKGQVPPFAKSVSVWSESNKGEIEYLVCENEATLLYLANLGCIEINPWSSRAESLERPDYMIFDIDPNGHPFEDVIAVAREIGRVLDRSCERYVAKTSGKTGLHILVPLDARHTYDDVKDFSHLVMLLVHRALPGLTSLERSPKKRGGKIYLDYLQNRFGQTIAAPYSVRPFPGATVSAPLAWSEVKEGLDPSRFTIRTIGKRLAQEGDLMAPLLGAKVDLADAIRCLEAELGDER